MTSRPIFDTTDPDVFFRLQIAALKAGRTLAVNTVDMGDIDFGEGDAGDVDADTLADIFSQTPEDQVVIAFHTSGSTGQPKRVPHTWGHLIGDARAIASSVGITAGMKLSTVLTVPLDHMFGFSYGFMLTNLMGFQRPRERVVVPKSLLAALIAAEHPVMLVTTPTHLKMYVESTIPIFPNVAWIFCATSQIPEGLSEAVQEKFNTPITDIYGCTEAGTLAFRTMSDPAPDWQCLDGMTLTHINDQFVFETPYFDKPVVIDDRLNLTGPITFQFVGRASDLIKIGGKRQSLAGLGCMVEALDNVREAKFFLPADEPNARLVLFAAFDGPADFDAVREALKSQVDHVFLPRHCVAVDTLPRNENGKLPRSALDALYKAHLQTGKQLQSEGA